MRIYRHATSHQFPHPHMQLAMTTALELLFAALKSSDPVEQAEAARLLGEAAVGSAVEPLLQYVEASLHYHKSAGFTALGRIGDTSACNRIYALIDDPRMRDDFYWFGWKSVRAAASHALLLLGDSRGEAFLTQLAENRDDVFFSWFAPAILQLPNGMDSIVRLKARLTVNSLFDTPELSTRISDPSRLTAIVDALGWIGGDVAAQKAAEFLDHRSRYVRGQAALSVTRAGGSSYKNQVQKVIESDPTDFAKAKAAVALEDERTLVSLAQTAADPFEKAVAIEGLGKFGAVEAASIVEAATGDTDPYVRQCAIEALEELDPARAVDAATRALEDPVTGVRMQAAKTLVVLKRGQA